jgi:hypothetical protein
MPLGSESPADIDIDAGEQDDDAIARAQARMARFRWVFVKTVATRVLITHVQMLKILDTTSSLGLS